MDDAAIPITDDVLAAMAHPLRRRLLDVLAVQGPATASALAQQTSQGVGNISHHLRVLAGAGLITEDPTLARDRRERWWRRVGESISWPSPDNSSPASSAAVAIAAELVNLDTHVERVRRWVAERADPDWIRSAFATDAWLVLSAAELAEFSQEITEVQRRWKQRDIPDDGQERRHVYTFTHGNPATP